MKEIVIGFIEPRAVGVGLGCVNVAKRRGYKVVAFASDASLPDMYQYRDVVDEVIVTGPQTTSSIIEAIDKSSYKGRFDAILGIEHFTILMAAEVSAHYGLVTQDPEVYRRAKYKHVAREYYVKAGAPCPKFQMVKNFHEAKAAVERIGFPVIIKPTDGVSSFGVFHIKNLSDLKNALGYLEKVEAYFDGSEYSRMFLIEEFIEGQHFNVDVFLLDGKVLFGEVSETLDGAPKFFTSIAHVLPTSIHADKTDLMIKTGVQALKALGFNDGCANVDLILSSKGPVIVECNLRHAGERTDEQMEYAFGVNLFEALLDYKLGKPVHIKATKRMGVSIAGLIVERSGVLKGIKGFEKIEGMPGVKIFRQELPPGFQIGPPSETLYCIVASVITCANTPAEAKKAALKAISCLEIEYDEATSAQAG